MITVILIANYGYHLYLQRPGLILARTPNTQATTDYLEHLTFQFYL